MATDRKALSKKTRFEVFKRDGFTCSYCGRHPPAVVLHVDHVIALAAGGTDEIDNLLTSCEACNLGKGARPLDVAPETVAAKALRIREAEEQLAAYQAVARERAARVEDETWEVAEALWPGCSTNGASRADLVSIKRFVEKLGVVKVLEMAEVAKARKPYGGKGQFQFFCGCCWKSIRDLEEGPR